MVKLFIGNLPREATEQEIRSLFEQYGKVLECDIIKNYGFVHIEDKTAAEDAIRNLHHYKLHGVNINVEASKNKSKTSTKLHVGNISPTCTNKELRAKFEEYGPVIECDIVKDYAFVHMERAEDAVEAIRGLDNTEFQGKRMHVQLSTSRLRTAPGMGDQSGCYRTPSPRSQPDSICVWKSKQCDVMNLGSHLCAVIELNLEPGHQTQVGCVWAEIPSCGCA
ncbi:RNA-binding protein 4 isoform X4 [Bubalus kerabau]|uniref:RNA-binding protein 4 isoform X4 n=1 Tax=Bubalus carabanensis TaxID=3119969 RepID=UPI00244E680B|nr:RNA-binding protein 4 isoform X4 [Bubalus carabanensis]